MMLMVLIRNQFDMHTQNEDALGAEQPPGSPDPDEICQNQWKSLFSTVHPCG